MKTTALLATVTMMTAGAGGYAIVHDTGSPFERDLRPLTRVELEQPTADNVYDAVKALRPGWLADDANENWQAPRIYIEARCSELTCLRWVESDHVERVHFLDPGNAGQVWPTPTKGGAVIVELKTRATSIEADVGER